MALKGILCCKGALPAAAPSSIMSSSSSRSLTIVTGASRGFGAALVPALLKSGFGRRAAANDYVLVSRHLAALQVVKKQCADLARQQRAQLVAHAMDLGDLDALEGSMAALSLAMGDGGVLPRPTASYSSVLLVQNAAATGDLVPMRQQRFGNTRAMVDLNITSFACITSHLMHTFCGTGQCQDLHIVNMSSVSADSVYETFGLYSAAKAARRSFVQTIALEQAAAQAEPATRVRCMNYAPGPLDTEMQADARERLPPGRLKDRFEHMLREKLLVSPSAAAEHLVRVLEADEYDNGADVKFVEVHPLSEG